MQPEKQVSETRRQLKIKITKDVKGFLQMPSELRKYIIETIEGKFSPPTPISMPRPV
jgi:hypothetical protein